MTWLCDLSHGCFLVWSKIRFCVNGLFN